MKSAVVCAWPIDKMSRNPGIFLALALVATTSAAPTASSKHHVEPCSTYRAHVIAARGDLSRGERAKAVHDLELARAALEGCKQLHDGSQHRLAMRF
jgi:hypothetical protein